MSKFKPGDLVRRIDGAWEGVGKVASYVMEGEGEGKRPGLFFKTEEAMQRKGFQQSSYGPFDEREWEKVEAPAEVINQVHKDIRSPETPKPYITTPKAYLEQFRAIQTKMLAITEAKNSDYTAGSGDAFKNFRMVEAMGVTDAATGILTRMSDKFIRISSLLRKGYTPKVNESVEDTLIDLANYSIILAVLLRESNG